MRYLFAKIIFFTFSVWCFSINGNCMGPGGEFSDQPPRSAARKNCNIVRAVCTGLWQTIDENVPWRGLLSCGAAYGFYDIGMQNLEISSIVFGLCNGFVIYGYLTSKDEKKEEKATPRGFFTGLWQTIDENVPWRGLLSWASVCGFYNMGMRNPGTSSAVFGVCGGLLTYGVLCGEEKKTQ